MAGPRCGSSESPKSVGGDGSRASSISALQSEVKTLVDWSENGGANHSQKLRGRVMLEIKNDPRTDRMAAAANVARGTLVEVVAGSAMVLTGEHFGLILDLRLQAESAEELQCISAAPLPPGASVSVGFAQAGRVALMGTVVGCERATEEFRLSIRLRDRLPAPGL